MLKIEQFGGLNDEKNYIIIISYILNVHNIGIMLPSLSSIMPYSFHPDAGRFIRCGTNESMEDVTFCLQWRSGRGGGGGAWQTTWVSPYNFNFKTCIAFHDCMTFYLWFYFSWTLCNIQCSCSVRMISGLFSCCCCFCSSFSQGACAIKPPSFFFSTLATYWLTRVQHKWSIVIKLFGD